MTTSQTGFLDLFPSGFFFEYLWIEFEDRYISINLMVVAQRGLKMDTFPLGRIRIGIAGYSPPKIYRRSPAQASSSSKENLKWKKRKSKNKKLACGTNLDRHTFVKSGASYCAGLNAFPRSSEPILWLAGSSDGRDRKLGKVWSLSRWQAETPARWSMSTTTSNPPPAANPPACQGAPLSFNM